MRGQSAGWEEQGLLTWADGVECEVYCWFVHGGDDWVCWWEYEVEGWSRGVSGGSGGSGGQVTDLISFRFGCRCLRTVAK